MKRPIQLLRRITATVDEVLPDTGLAFATDDDARLWGLTRSTPGAGLASLWPGLRVNLTVIEQFGFELISDYLPLDMARPEAGISA